MSNIIPHDPCGHAKIAVSDFKKSYPFYKAIFDELGYKEVVSDEDTAGWSSLQGYGIWISQAKIPSYKYNLMLQDYIIFA